MPAYKHAQESDSLPLPSQPDCIVEFKRRANYGDYSAAVMAAFRLIPDKQDQPIDWYNAYVEGAVPELILSWNLEDEDGRPLPITMDTVRSLSRIDGDFIITQVGSRLRGRPEPEEVVFAKGSGPSSKGSRSTRRRS